MKFAWAGLVPQFITYTTKLLSGVPTTPEITAEDRRHLATLTVMAYLVQLCALKSGAGQQQHDGTKGLLKISSKNSDNEFCAVTTSNDTGQGEEGSVAASSAQSKECLRADEISREKSTVGFGSSNFSSNKTEAETCEEMHELEIQDANVVLDERGSVGEQISDTKDSQEILGNSARSEEISNELSSSCSSNKSLNDKESQVPCNDDPPNNKNNDHSGDKHTNKQTKLELSESSDTESLSKVLSGNKDVSELGCSPASLVEPSQNNSSHSLGDKASNVQLSTIREHATNSKKEEIGKQTSSPIISPSTKNLFSLPKNSSIGVSASKSTLATLLLFLKNNHSYDPLLCMCLAAEAWRWETVQYLSTARGFVFEKLAVLLSKYESPLLITRNGEQEDETIGDHHSCFDSSNSLFGQHSRHSRSRFKLNRDEESGYLHCLSDPELRSVLLINMTLAKLHINRVLNLLPILNTNVLFRLASLYDPSHPVLVPFLSSVKILGKSEGMYRTAVEEYIDATANEEQDHVSLRDIVGVFLKILIRLNQARGWVHQPDLLDVSPQQPTNNVSYLKASMLH